MPEKFSFTVSRDGLMPAVQHVSLTTMTYKDAVEEAYACLLFTIDGKLLTLHSSNSSDWMQQSVALDDDPEGEVRPFAVEWRVLMKTLKALEQQPLRFIVGEYQLTVVHACGKFMLPLAKGAVEFAELPRPQLADRETRRLEFEASGLRSILTRCRFAMAQDELRPVMNGVYINVTREYTDYVSSDGHMLVRVRKEGYDFKDSCIIPRHVVSLLLKILPKTGDVVFSFDAYREETVYDERKMKNVTKVTQMPFGVFEIDDTITLRCNLIDGMYPRYWSVIPDYHAFSMTIARRAFIKSIDRMTEFAYEPSRLLMLNVEKDNVRLNTEDKDFGYAAEETLPCDCAVGNMPGKSGKNLDGNLPLEIGLKATSLSQTLKMLDSASVECQMTDALRCVILRPKPQPDVEDITMMLMPMLISD